MCESGRQLKFSLAQTSERIGRQLGRNSAACFELTNGLCKPGLRSELSEQSKCACQVLHGVASSTDFPKPTAIVKEDSGVLKGTDDLNSISQGLAKELVHAVGPSKQPATACQSGQRRRALCVAYFLLEN